jgi:hypothetical protein
MQHCRPYPLAGDVVLNVRTDFALCNLSLPDKKSSGKIAAARLAG